MAGQMIRFLELEGGGVYLSRVAQTPRQAVWYVGSKGDVKNSGPAG